MVDAQGLGPCGRKAVGVQVPPSALSHMESQIKRLPKHAVELTFTIPPDEVKKTYELILAETVKTVEVKGFRKGKAPRKKVEEQLNKVKVNEEILRNLLPKAYTDAIREHNIQPIVNPRIEIVSMEEGKDWQFRATTCEKPEVKLNDYKDRVKSITAKSKIVVPGKQPTPLKPEEIINALLEAANVEIPDFVVDAEVDRMLAHTLSEIKTLGLTLEQYLATTGKTPQTLREEYRKQAGRDLKLEFILEAISDTEKVTVSQAEIDEAVKQVKDPKQQEAVSQNPYMLAQILRRQKTLDFINNL